MHGKTAFRTIAYTLQVFLPLGVTHLDSIDVDNVLVHLTDWILTLRITYRDVFTAVETLASVETRRSSVARDDRAEEWVGYLGIHRILVAIDMNLDGA
jgi:hypothetical protein